MHATTKEPVTPTPPTLPVPRHATLRASAVYLLASISLGFPALAGKFLVNPRSDQYIAGYAFREFAATTLRDTGHFPLWNPYLFGGMPYVAAMHGDVFYPTFLLRLALPTDTAMTWGFIIHLFLAGLFTFLFLRAIGLGFFAALVGGLAYMLGGNVAGLASPGHDGKLFISALLPLTLLLVTRLVRDARPWSFGALAFTIGLCVLTPHPQLLQYLLLVSGAYAAVVALTDMGLGKPARDVALRRLALAGGAVLIGLAIGAIQFVPVREYVSWSPRASGKVWEDAVSFSLPPEEIFNFYLPQFTGMFDRAHNYWGRNGIHLHSEYMGVAVLVLAGLALWRSWADSERRLIRFWIGVLGVSLLWAMGGYTPFYRLVFAIVPGTRFFRAPSTMLFVVSFALAVLAAFGTERVVRGSVSRRYLIGWGIAAALIGALGVSSGLTNLAISLTQRPLTNLALANDAVLRVGAIRSTLFAAFVLAVLFLLDSRRLAAATGGALLAAVVAADLWSVERSYWIFSEPASRLFASDEIIDYLNRQAEPGRVLPLPTDPEKVAYHDPFLYGDALMTHRIRSPLGYHGNELGRYDQLGSKSDEWASVANPNFWALLNIRFILTENNKLEGLGLQNIKHVLGPVKNSAGTFVHLYRISDENPAAWIVPVIVKAPDSNMLGTVLDPRFDVRRAGLFDTSTAVRGQSIQSLPDPLSIKARVTKYEPGAIDVQLDAPAPAGSALIVSENYYPGWTASVDGKAGTIGRADMTLIGVELPAGGKAISLRFQSRSYKTGRVITLVAMTIALLVWGGGAILGRRGSG